MSDARSQITLHPMRDADIPDVLAIERLVFTTPWTESMFKQEVRGVFNSRTTVARSGTRIIGYQIAWFIEDEVHLVNIAVHPEYHGRGIGAQMLTSLIGVALDGGKRIVTLEVRESNAHAQRFYRRFYFNTIGIRKAYYSDNREDALLMVLDLAEYVARKGEDEGTSQAG